MVHSTISFFGGDPQDRMRQPRRRAEKVNSRDGLAVAGIGIAVVFGRNLIILLAQLQPLLI